MPLDASFSVLVPQVCRRWPRYAGGDPRAIQFRRAPGGDGAGRTVGLVATRDSRIEWCLLALCVAIVLTAEIFNSALEQLAKAITREHDAHIRAALDMASGAVLLASVGAAIVGTVVLLFP